MKKDHFLKKLSGGILVLAVIAAAAVFLFDPFFHYHKPIRPLKAVLTQAEYQVIGTLKNFEYNALIVGSSMAENYNNHEFDEAFHTTAIKAVKPAANTADLMYLLEIAFKEQEIEKIFYTLDISALTSPRRESTFEDKGMPTYLYNENPLDDIQYLFNKDILFKEIPYMIANSFLMDYDEGDSYNWAKYKDFSTFHYEPIKERLPMQTVDKYVDNVDWSVDKLVKLVEKHPETDFFFILPPYSSLWWYESEMNGETEANFYALQKACDKLLPLNNVEIHYFQHVEEWISDLDLYIDLLHFHPDVNRSILDGLQTKEYQMTEENKKSILEEMRLLSQKCISTYAKEYFNE